MRIAIVRLSSLGDVIQTMVVTQFIRSNYPNSIIDWYVDTDFVDLVRANPDIDNVFTVSFRSFKRAKKNFIDIFKQLLSFNNKYDILIDYQGLLKSAIVSRLIKAKKRVGYSKKSCREPLASFFYNSSYEIPYKKNVYIRYTELTSKALDIEISNKSIENRKQYLFVENPPVVSDPKIGIFVGASKKEKMYSIDRYVELINKLDQSFLLIHGSKSEEIIAKKIKSLTKNKNVSISKRLSLLQLVQEISALKVLIGSDTGPLHLAWALKIPSLVLFGPTESARVFFPTNINKAIDINIEDQYEYMSIIDIKSSHIINIMKKIGVVQ